MDHVATAGDGVRIVVHRLRAGGGVPVLLAPGSFSTRAFWIGARGQGFASELAAAGFDPWVLEPRGHGASERPGVWSMVDWIERDAPAAARVVLEATGASGYYWVGHSAGGVVGAAFSGTAHASARALRGLVLLGSPGPGTLTGRRRWFARGMRVLAGAFPRARVPGTVLRLGPEHEPASMLHHWFGWNLAGAWRDPRGGDYLAALAALRLPVLAVAGGGDRWLAPADAVADLLSRFGGTDHTLIRAGLASGFRRDYGHAGMMIGRDARAEVWPRVVGWLKERARSPDPRTHTQRDA